MIKVEQGTVRIKGSLAELEVELTAVVKGFYQAVVKGFGEEFADKRMDFILEKALDSAEVEAETNPEQKIENAVKIIDALRRALEIIEEMEGEK